MNLIQKIILTLILLIIFTVPLKAQAISLPKILPDCDVTVYQVEIGGDATLNEDKCKNVKCIYASDYDKAKNGNIVNVFDYNACGFDNFVGLLINAYRFGLSLLAVAVLFFFIWGGFGMIIAAGRPEHIQKAKNVLKGAVVGMLIVLTAWIMVNFYIFAFAEDTRIDGMFWWGGGEECHTEFNLACEKNNLKYGCGGERGSPTDINVQRVQRDIGKLDGCDCGAVDGCFGKQTHECVFNFQINSGIADPIGVVGENTWKIIAEGSGTCNASFEPVPILPKEEYEYCCIPDDTPNNPLTRCLDVLEKKDCINYNEQGLYNYAVEGSCIDHEICEVGFCLPTDLSKSCYYTDTGCLSDEVFNNDELATFIDCQWHVCVEILNTCYVQRSECRDTNHETNYIYSTEEDALSKMNNYDDCNYGTCAEFSHVDEDDPAIGWYACDWIAKSKCNTSLVGTYFYPELRVPILPPTLPDGIGNCF